MDPILRAATLGIRGSFSFILIKFLNEADYGSFIVISAVVSLFQYIIAGDFNYIAHRMLLAKAVDLSSVLGTQIVVLCGLTMVSIIPAINYLPNSLTFIQTIISINILLFETVSNELQRHLIVLGKATESNVVMLLKSACWMVTILTLWRFNVIGVKLIYLLLFWLKGLIIGALLGSYFIKNDLKSRLIISKPLLLSYLKKIPIIIIGTISIRALFSIDRLFVGKQFGDNQAAIYGVYIGIALAYTSLVDAAILNRRYPELVCACTQSWVKFTKMRSVINCWILISVFVTIGFYLAFGKHLFSLVGKTAWWHQSEIGIWIIVAYALYAMSFADNSYIYAHGCDVLIGILNILVLSVVLIGFECMGFTLVMIARWIAVGAGLNLVIKRLAVMLTSKNKGKIISLSSIPVGKGA